MRHIWHINQLKRALSARFGTLCVICLALSGCASGTSGVKWWAPSTYFSHAPADKVDRAVSKEDAAREGVIKAAQKTAHETSIALAEAPQSRPVDVAVDSNASTVALLDQAAGPLSAGELSKLRATVTGLLSENAKIRAEAEKQRAKEQRDIAGLSAALAKAETASETAKESLRKAFERENALANELRAQKAAIWIVGALAVILAAGWIYARIALGGIPSAIGMAMSDLKVKHPDVAKLVAPIYKGYLNRSEQAEIARRSRP
jgi:hypothetical protein